MPLRHIPHWLSQIIDKELYLNHLNVLVINHIGVDLWENFPEVQS